MNTFVLKSLWNRRKQYVWLFAELVVITIVSWIVFDPAVIILYNAHQPMGYDVEQLCYGELRVSYDEEKDDPDILRAQLTTIDGIEDVYTCDMYFHISEREYIVLTTFTDNDTCDVPAFSYNSSSHFFETYGIKPLPGSPSAKELSRLNPADNQVVLTRNAAICLFGTTDVIGRSFQRMADNPSSYTRLTVVGVVENIHHTIKSVVFCPQKRRSPQYVIFRLRKGLTPSTFLEEHQDEIFQKGSGTSFQMCKVMPLDQYDHQQQLKRGRPQKANKNLAMALFFMISLCLGVVGTMWLQSKKRTEECGVMRAYGASRFRIMLDFLTEGWVLVTIAVLIGCVLYFQYIYSGITYVTYGKDGHIFSEFLYGGFSPTKAGMTWMDELWPHFLVISAIVYLIILTTVSIGIAIPAWNICRKKPVEALREE